MLSEARPKAPPVRGFRPEIEGLRAVACILVAIFHIWLGRVSGGVDVFFTVSGFLITVTLLRQIEKFGRPQPGAFLGRLARRLIPASAFVIAVVFIATLVVLPPAVWRSVFTQVWASAIYGENWYLALNAVDYLATDVSKSPLQHLWATSVQGQFYVIWLLIAVVAGLLLKGRRGMLVAVIIVFAMSLAYSIIETNAHQEFAYFSTFTRVWEFALGSLLALLLPWLRLPRTIAAVLGWAGLAAILACGLVLNVSTIFPGFAALWPTLAAAMVILSGGQSGAYGVDRLLGSRPFTWLGGLAYGIYLWHWPLLVFALTLRGNGRAGFATGLVIILGAIVLAWLTKKFIEGPFARAGGDGAKLRRRTATSIVVASSLVLVGAGVVGGAGMDRVDAAEAEAAQALQSQPCFGASAMVTAPDPCINEQLDGVFVPISPADDHPEIFSDECRTNAAGTEVKPCVWGDPDSEVRVALIGNSHAASYFPAFLRIVEKLGWRLDTYLKSGCTYSAVARGKPGEEWTASCAIWSSELTKVLADVEPYTFVLTSANGHNVSFDVVDGVAHPEAGIEGYRDVWQPLIDRGATMLIVKDYPRSTPEILECAQRDPSDPTCARPESEAFVTPGEEVLLNAAEGFDGAEVIRMDEWFCSNGMCPAVIGNVHVYFDGGHLTDTYSRTLAPFLWAELARVSEFPDPENLDPAK